MQTTPHLSDDALELRRRAEAHLLGQQATTPARTYAADQRLLHELQIDQIELEIQNVELLETRDELASALEKYTELYDFAPVGYLTLDRAGTIREANLAGASLLGTERAALVSRQFELFVAPADRPAFTAFLKNAFASKARQLCRLSLLAQGQPPIAVEVKAAGLPSGQACQLALRSLAERQQARRPRLLPDQLESARLLAGGSALDLNNLLTVLLLDLDLARAIVPPGGKLSRRLAAAKADLLAGLKPIPASSLPASHTLCRGR